MREIRIALLSLTLVVVFGLATPRQAAAGSYRVITLGSFTADQEGPSGDLARDAQGNLYGTAANGGSLGPGAVWKLAVGSNTVTTLANFTNLAYPLSGALLDMGGNIYGTTSNGLTGGLGTVWTLSPGSNTVPPWQTHYRSRRCHESHAAEKKPTIFRMTVVQEPSRKRWLSRAAKLLRRVREILRGFDSR
jgi:uncharacterized repeat protein (TIGR03803 family)